MENKIEGTERMLFALRMVGIQCNEIMAETLIQVFEKIGELGDQFSLRDASKIKADMDDKYKKLEETKQK